MWTIQYCTTNHCMLCHPSIIDEFALYITILSFLLLLLCDGVGGMSLVSIDSGFDNSFHLFGQVYLEIPNGGRIAEALHSKVTSMRFLDHHFDQIMMLI